RADLTGPWCVLGRPATGQRQVQQPHNLRGIAVIGLERGVRELLRGAEEDGVGAETGDEDVAVRSDVYTFRAQREVTYSVAAGGLQCRRCLSHHGTRLFRWESGGAGQRAQVR